jgi:hydroxypyruvate isomerase
MLEKNLIELEEEIKRIQIAETNGRAEPTELMD